MRLLIALLLVCSTGAIAADLPKATTDALNARLSKLDNYPLCLEAGRASRNTDSSPKAQKWAEMVLAKVKRSGWVSDIDIANFRGRNLTIGMDSCAAYAALGRPSRVSSTNYPQGKLMQWAYERPGRSTRYLHFVDDKLGTFDD